MARLAWVLDEILAHLDSRDICSLCHTNNELRSAIQAKVKGRIAVEFPWMSLDEWFEVVRSDHVTPSSHVTSPQPNLALFDQITAAVTRPVLPGPSPESPRKYTWYHFHDESAVVVQHVIEGLEWQFEVDLKILQMSQKEVYELVFSAHHETLIAYVRQEERFVVFSHVSGRVSRPVDHVLIIPVHKCECLLRVYQGQVFYIERMLSKPVTLLETSLFLVDIPARSVHLLCSTKLPEQVFSDQIRSFRTQDAPIILNNRVLYLCDPDRSYLLVFNLLLKSVRLLLLPQNRRYSRNVYIENGRYMHFVSEQGGVALDLVENEIRDVSYDDVN